LQKLRKPFCCICWSIFCAYGSSAQPKAEIEFPLHGWLILDYLGLIAFGIALEEVKITE
jgi:hypothetical protein